MTDIFIKRGNLNTEKGTQGDWYMKTRVVLPQAEGLPEARREAQSLGRKHGPADILLLNFWPPEQ